MISTIYDNLKNYLIDNPSYFTELGLPALASKNFNFGVVDLLKQKGSLFVAILPEAENEVDEDDDLTGEQMETQFTVAFICTQDKQSALDDKVMKYATAFRKAVISDASLGGTVDRSSLGERKYYFDAGIDNGQLSCVEITFNVITTTTL